MPFAIAVISPLPLTVTDGYVKVPTFEFTVASVPAAVTLLEPSNTGEVYAKSPVIERVRPVAKAVAVEELPVTLPVIPPEKVMLVDVALPGNKYANVSYAILLAAVTNPFAFTVRLLKVPMLLFTVAKVNATEPGPLAVPSPVRAVM